MTRTTPLRRMILQFLHIFFTDALTFIVVSSNDPYQRTVPLRP
jgi:hypothetical protein